MQPISVERKDALLAGEPPINEQERNWIGRRSAIAGEHKYPPKRRLKGLRNRRRVESHQQSLRSGRLRRPELDETWRPDDRRDTEAGHRPELDENWRRDERRDTEAGRRPELDEDWRRDERRDTEASRPPEQYSRRTNVNDSWGSQKRPASRERSRVAETSRRVKLGVENASLAIRCKKLDRDHA